MRHRGKIGQVGIDTRPYRCAALLAGATLAFVNPARSETWNSGGSAAPFYMYPSQASSNVGIGSNAAPIYQLHIISKAAGTEASQGIQGYGNRSAFYFLKANGTSAAPANVGTSDQIGIVESRAYSGTGYQAMAAIDFKVDGSFTSGQRPPSMIEFYTNTANGNQTPNMLIKNDGKVGIGTLTPSALLNVSTAVAVNADANIARFGNRLSTGRTAELSVDYRGTMGDGTIVLREDRAGVDFMTVNMLSASNKVVFPNGNIGIGANPPLAAKLNVDQNTAVNEQIVGIYANSKKMADIQAPDAGAAGYFALYQKDVVAPIIQLDARALSTKNSFINSGGFFGVGTNDPKALLNVKRDGTQANLVLVQGNAGGNATLKALTLSNTNSPNAGNLGQAIDQDFSMEGPSSVQYPAARFHAGKESDWTGSLANVDSYLGISTTKDGVTSEKVRISSNGNLGIGINPSAKLDVSDVATGNMTTIFRTNLDYGGGVTGDWAANSLSATFGAGSSGTLTGLQVSVSSPTPQKTYAAVFLGGKVGVGTSTPSTQLDVVGNSGVRIAASGLNGVLTLNSDDQGSKITSSKGQGGNRNLRFTDVDYNSGVETETMRITNDGQVGIGTTSPQPGVKLDVAGSANISGTLTVASLTTHVWSVAPDYVFEKDYKLAALDHVEKYVDEHKHLPDIPSARDFKEKGIDLAEMNMKLLRKVEELTLYSIKQEKRINELSVRLQKVERK